MAATFKNKYGIKLTVVRGIDSELIPKVEAEASTGNAVADVFAFASTQWAVDNSKKGAFVAPVGPSFDNPDYNRAKLVVGRRHVLHLHGCGVRLRLEHRPVLEGADGIPGPARCRTWATARSA